MSPATANEPRKQTVKIDPKDYLYMRDALARNKDLIPAFRAQIAADPRVKDSAKRLRWDLANYSDLTGFFCSVIYKYANDSHIDTALKSIMRELEP